MPVSTIELDGKKAEVISSFLMDIDVDEVPASLAANDQKAFVGTYVLGLGFLFEDNEPGATSVAEMHRILKAEPASRAFVKPYVGGEQVNNQAEFSPERYAIDFGEMTQSEAGEHKELFRIVSEKVRPERAKLDHKKYARRALEWWKHSSSNPNMLQAIKGNEKVLVANCAAAKFLTFSFLPAGCVYSHKLYVFADESYGHFAVLQSTLHDVWARFFGGSMGDQLTYTGTRCYGNFPFPHDMKDLEAVGSEYYNARALLMSQRGLGLTPFYNLVHNSLCVDDEVRAFRLKRVEMDNRVLSAYGWADIHLNIEDYCYSGDYVEDGVEGEVRMNFPESVRDEILRRLLALHAKRLHAEKTAVPSVGVAAQKAKKPKKSKDSSGPELFNL
jgi:hypothetical protein